MSALLLAELADRGIRIGARGGNLRFAAPPGTLTPELRARLAEQKPELLSLLAAAPRACFCCFACTWWTTPALRGVWRCGACHSPVQPAVWALPAEDAPADRGEAAA